ncbi:MAG: hypothetical protein M1816_006189 [Peltula sp. TS41687]|nr:MAG: hypothetical protein M1816_006189 [Peltula sp. TS41687]
MAWTHAQETWTTLGLEFRRVPSSNKVGAQPQQGYKPVKQNTYLSDQRNASGTGEESSLSDLPDPSPSASHESTIQISSQRVVEKPRIPFVIPSREFRMAFQARSRSRTSTMDSNISIQSNRESSIAKAKPNGHAYYANRNGSQTSFSSVNGHIPHDASLDQESATESFRSVEGAGQSAGPSPAVHQRTPNITSPPNPNRSTSLSGLVCNVHRTTGKEPHPLVGASTTILGDKLYVFGGRILSRTRPQFTANLYELDLIRRHWTRIETQGDVPPPRYFHTVCALGDSKLVCYGGMSPAVSQVDQAGGVNATQASGGSQDAQSESVVLSDIHVYDVPTRTWTFVPTVDTPQGRYAHCATILPSSGIFTSAGAPLSAIRHNPASSTGDPNQGYIGVSLDGTGGAEMVVVGGQDSSNHYIESISVFNLRSLKWTGTSSLGKSCGAYRSVVAPLTGISSSRLGNMSGHKSESGNGEHKKSEVPEETGSSMLIYSNYNFLDVKLELQVRLPDGTLIDKPMRGHFSPPGLRFPNGGVLDRHFVVSGTYLTSSKQEYALWALDLKNLTWSRIDAGGNHFSQGSWNRGVLWKRRNMFVILGNRKRSLVEDYNHRRINFSNVCLVELEAFGMYDNPRTTAPTSGFVSASSPIPRPFSSLNSGYTSLQGGGRPHTSAAESLGASALNLRDLADMDLLALDGERVPVNSAIVARRWGPYFNQLMREGATIPEATREGIGLRPPASSMASRNSSITITPSIGASSSSTSTTITNNNPSSSTTTVHRQAIRPPTDYLSPPTPENLPPISRSRTLYLPHTHLTLQTLVYYFYTSSLPPPNHPFCTPQILCSLLQLARPYRIDGLLEAVVERLHQVFDGRNAAAVFNAAAMAAGGGLASSSPARGPLARLTASVLAANQYPSTTIEDGDSDVDVSIGGGHKRKTLLRINTTFVNDNGTASSRPPTATDTPRSAEADLGNDDEQEEAEISSAASTSASTNTTSSEYDLTDTGLRGEREIWSGEISSVIGLQKRGLRGMMEGRRMRERGRSQGNGGTVNGGAGAGTTTTNTAAMTPAPGQSMSTAAAAAAAAGSNGSAERLDPNVPGGAGPSSTSPNNVGLGLGIG